MLIGVGSLVLAVDNNNVGNVVGIAVCMVIVAVSDCVVDWC